MILTNQNCPNCRNNVKPEHMSSEGLLELAIHNILYLTVAVVHKDKNDLGSLDRERNIFQ